MPFKVIVVGTDGSSRASMAVDEAFALAKAYGSTVHVVNAVSSGVAAGLADSRSAQFSVTEMQAYIDRTRQRVVAYAEQQGIPVDFHTPGKNDPADGIVEVATNVNADLIVVGNRGMSGIKRFVLGSVPNKISHSCPCSLLIVNTEPD
jgi:nucleotide-binding universal stress UspA family protein